jgi:hypothetical protein
MLYYATHAQLLSLFGLSQYLIENTVFLSYKNFFFVKRTYLIQNSHLDIRACHEKQGVTQSLTASAIYKVEIA